MPVRALGECSPYSVSNLTSERRRATHADVGEERHKGRTSQGATVSIVTVRNDWQLQSTVMGVFFFFFLHRRRKVTLSGGTPDVSVRQHRLLVFTH